MSLSATLRDAWFSPSNAQCPVLMPSKGFPTMRPLALTTRPCFKEVCLSRCKQCLFLEHHSPRRRLNV